MRVFGVIRSYLVCVELIIDVFRKIKNFDEKIFFPMKNLKSWSTTFRDFQNSLPQKSLRNFRILKNLKKLLTKIWDFSSWKKKFSSKFLIFLKTSIISSTHTKYERITPKTRKVMTVYKKNWGFFCIFLGIRGMNYTNGHLTFWRPHVAILSFC